MNMNFFESCLYGLFSGLAEFLPASAEAHQLLLRQLFGVEGKLPLLNLFVHIGALLALLECSKDYLRRLYREYQLKKIPRRRRRRPSDAQSSADIALLKTAIIPLLLGFVLYAKSQNWQESAHIVAPLLFVNGIILYIPMYLPVGNKDSRSMSPLDGLLFGLSCTLGVLPGISRVATVTAVSVARGAEPQQGYRWSLLLCIPALLGVILFDIISLFTVGLSGIGVLGFIQFLISGITAFAGAYIGMTLIKSVLQKSGVFNFAYYCWGAAILTFILYLI